MSVWSAAADKAEKALKLYYTIEQQLHTMEKTVDLIRAELTASRIELVTLAGRVSKLEEARNTIDALMNNVKSEAKAETEKMRAEVLGELRAVKAETIAEIKVQNVKEMAAMHNEFVEAKAALNQTRQRKAGNAPEIERDSGNKA